MVLRMKLLVADVAMVGSTINQTTEGLNVNLLMKPTRSEEKSKRGH